MLKIYLIICLLILSACTTTKTTNVFIPKLADPDQVIIYIYRPSNMSNAMYSPDLYINSEFKQPIKNGKNMRLTLAPGEYKFEIDPDKNYAGLTTLSMNLNAGKIYYIRVDTSLKVKSVTNYEPYQRSFNMIKVDEKLALKQIAECCMTKNKKTINKTNSVEKQTGDGFSVDKTQNPFSH